MRCVQKEGLTSSSHRSGSRCQIRTAYGCRQVGFRCIGRQKDRILILVAGSVAGKVKHKTVFRLYLFGYFSECVKNTLLRRLIVQKRDNMKTAFIEERR